MLDVVWIWSVNDPDGLGRGTGVNRNLGGNVDVIGAGKAEIIYKVRYTVSLGKLLEKMLSNRL